MRWLRILLLPTAVLQIGGNSIKQHTRLRKLFLLDNFALAFILRISIVISISTIHLFYWQCSILPTVKEVGNLLMLLNSCCAETFGADFPYKTYQPFMLEKLKNWSTTNSDSEHKQCISCLSCNTSHKRWLRFDSSEDVRRLHRLTSDHWYSFALEGWKNNEYF